MNFEIDDSKIEQSFDMIAKELINEHVILINDLEFEFTEIEFYYFKKGIHEDNYTHKHMRKAGEWRVHNQGLDITLEGNADQDGGILIRGLKHDDKFTNGPIKALALLLENMGSVFSSSTMVLKHKDLGEKQIIKTFRHIPNKIQDKTFHYKKYRYITDFDLVDISKPIKNQILTNCVEV